MKNQFVVKKSQVKRELMKQRIQNKHDDALKKYLKMFDSTTDKKMVIEEVFDNLDCIPKDIALWKTFIERVIPEKERTKASKELLSAFKQDYRIICSIESDGWWIGSREPFNRLKRERFADEEYMHRYCIIGHPNNLKKYILRGADVNQSIYKYDLLNTICGCERSEDLLSMVYMLLKAGANPNAPDKDNNSALMHLFCYNLYADKIEITKALLKAGADINWLDKWGNPAVFNLVMYDYRTECAEILKFLITNGAKIDVRNKRGNNIWHYLFSENKTDSVYPLSEILINSGISRMLKEVGRIQLPEKCWKVTPLELARRNKTYISDDLINLLEHASVEKSE